MPSFSFQYEVGPVCWALCKALRFGVDLGMLQSATRCLFLDIDANVMTTSQRPQTKSRSKTFWKNKQVGLDFLNKVFVEPVVVALFSPLMVADSKSWRIRFVFFHDLSTQVESDFTPLSLCQDHWQLCFRWKVLPPEATSVIHPTQPTRPGRMRNLTWIRSLQRMFVRENCETMCGCWVTNMLCACVAMSMNLRFWAKKFWFCSLISLDSCKDSHRVDRQNPVDRLNIQYNFLNIWTIPTPHLGKDPFHEQLYNLFGVEAVKRHETKYSGFWIVKLKSHWMHSMISERLLVLWNV